MYKLFYLSLLLLAFSCQQQPAPFDIPDWVPYDESAIIAANANHENERLRYRLVQSRITDKNDIWKLIEPQLAGFSVKQYHALKPLILEQDIRTLQNHVSNGRLTYVQLIQWYLYRMALYENDSTKTLHALLAVNPHAVEEARAADKNQSEKNHPIFGMPILLKDNVNTDGMPTTAGAHALMENRPQDAFIVRQLKKKGGIVLGKVNLSEWANYNCNDCPNGFSALGGQTLNPYGRGQHDTGGSSAGSGAAMAANYAVAAVGTETSGSILSPASSNAIAGLKPTIGLLSRTGIVPISSTLDTPGPMTRTVSDNAILLDALAGYDKDEAASVDRPGKGYLEAIDPKFSMEGLRFGVMAQYLEDTLFQQAVEQLQNLGATMVNITPPEMNFEGFGLLLGGDMFYDLANYLQQYTGPAVTVKSVADVLASNRQDSARRIPYGQGKIASVVDTTLTPESLAEIRQRLLSEGRKYFDTPMTDQNLDGVLSINNWAAGYAALAKFPCLTVPMGYQKDGRPMGITFISRPFEEDRLLQWGYTYEQASKKRVMPMAYR